MKVFYSQELIGTGKDEILVHDLGKIPSFVIIYPSSMSFVEYAPSHKGQLIMQGASDAKTSLRKRDLWPIISTADTITVKVIPGKKYKIVAFA